ncbi:hypothetical protein B0T17DRAFT_511532 [Bombardia bombarda]|uniref:Zn(2)-C6 fungal-type domain-containing protein n=1 Tax=Bombardia bombarda TaxID=252184 RepID=A0AA39TI67_9PEZI|nr:hypothetical protein B0T17DRAFT_511532 [Bombardia bombarda]
MTLPSLQYPGQGQGGYSPDPRYPEQQKHSVEQRYQQDQRAWSSESPTNSNGYAPPDSRYQLAPVQSGHERRQGDQSYQGQPPQGRGGGYSSEPYPYSYPLQGPYPYADYSRGPGAPPQQGQQQQQPAAPRQRTSIACRYCRKRKIRCSGYANTINGKCINCDKLRIECIFQPVSSNASTAFVPVSAVPGGVPPGTPLYGAYGQPLHPSQGGHQPPPPQQQQQEQQQQQQQRLYQHSPPDYPSSLHSPTSHYPSYDDRDVSRRRARPAEEDHVMRLPPPTFPPDEDPRRRSPASNHSSGTPPTVYHSYQGSYDQNITSTPHRNSLSGPGGPPYPKSSQPQPQPQQQPQPKSQASGSNPMSLNHLIAPDNLDRGSNSDIDKSMLGKLDRRS